MLSVIIIAKNEAGTIRPCLESVAWADEIIVLDSGSTDQTVAICREFTPNVHLTDWPGYGRQKNRALNLANGDWVLSIDADERISPELRAEIEGIINADSVPSHDTPVDAYRMPRLSSYCGRWIRHSGWWPDHVLRLTRRGVARFTDDLVHERMVIDGPIGTLTNPLMHETFQTLDAVLDKVNEYSTASARMQFERGKRGSLLQAVLRGLWNFFKTYVVRGGFLDGREGFMLAVSNAEGTYYRYLKLMLLERIQHPASVSSDVEPKTVSTNRAA
ncbi:MAG: glycosyltransferase family 2 protein [Planctomycetota bacterium]|nr:glycosyltransferase family 2 protein [Planctomycetota bacterium]